MLNGHISISVSLRFIASDDLQVTEVRIVISEVAEFISSHVHLENSCVYRSQSNWNTGEYLVKILCFPRISL